MSKLVDVELDGNMTLVGTLHHWEEVSERALTILNSDVTEYSFGLSRGDLVHVSWFDTYRNNGKFVFDGERFVGLYTGVDDYGSIPPSFQVITEFPIGWWRDVIDHNCTVFYTLTEEEYEEALSNMTGGCDEFETFFTKKAATRDAVRYRICINVDCNDDTDEYVYGLIEKGLREGVFSSSPSNTVSSEASDDYTLYLDILP